MKQVKEGVALYRALSVLSRRYQFRSRDEICCYGLTVSQCHALQVLADAGPMGTSDLAERLYLDLSAASRLAGRLLKKKLAAKARRGSDARVREIAITDAGRKLVGRIEVDFGRTLEQTLASFSPGVREALPEVLRRITRAMDGCCAE